MFNQNCGTDVLKQAPVLDFLLNLINSKTCESFILTAQTMLLLGIFRWASSRMLWMICILSYFFLKKLVYRIIFADFICLQFVYIFVGVSVLSVSAFNAALIL